MKKLATVLAARQAAFVALKAVHKGAFADVALDRALSQQSLSGSDSRLLTELVYGCVRRMRTLDVLIGQLARKGSAQQPPDVRAVLHLGLYQLRYLQIPPSAAVNTTVELLKHNRMGGLSGFANGLLRQYLRLSAENDPLRLGDNPIQRLGILHSYPDWIVETWVERLGIEAAEQLCIALNQPPTLDLRINPLKVERATVQAAFAEQGVTTEPLAFPQGLRIIEGSGPVHQLPGYAQGWWVVQEASAQLVGHLVNPRPGSMVLDLCAAPGGKTTHLVELMQGTGTVWACDRTASRLRRLHQNLERLEMTDSVKVQQADGRSLSLDLPDLPLFDAVLIDAPCSGLGTLHRHADARWRQTPATVQALAQLQSELLQAAAQQVKPNGSLVYATCTLHPLENERVVQQFLAEFPQWRIEPPQGPMFADFQSAAGWIKVWPHQQPMDGFFMVRLQRTDSI